MSKINFHPAATEEAKSSYAWYQEQTEGLGDDFLDEVETACHAILEFPDTWPPFQKRFRRFLLSKFPFSVIYRSDGDSIYVVAIMHNSREPGYWLERA